MGNFFSSGSPGETTQRPQQQQQQPQPQPQQKAKVTSASAPQQQQQQQRGPSGYDHHVVGDASYEPPAAQALRAQAHAASDQRRDLAARSHAAYQRGDGHEAKQLSSEGKQAEARASELNAQAARLTFEHNNRTHPPDTIDLHGLRVDEAMARIEERIKRDRAKGATHVVVIVGAGIHSQGGIAKIKPAAIALFQKLKVVATVDKPNHGCIYVELNGGDKPAAAHKQDEEAAQCVIM